MSITEYKHFGDNHIYVRKADHAAAVAAKDAEIERLKSILLDVSSNVPCGCDGEGVCITCLCDAALAEPPGEG